MEFAMYKQTGSDLHEQTRHEINKLFDESASQIEKNRGAASTAKKSTLAAGKATAKRKDPPAAESSPKKKSRLVDF